MRFLHRFARVIDVTFLYERVYPYRPPGHVCGYRPKGQKFCKLLVELVGIDEETIYKTFKLLLENKE